MFELQPDNLAFTYFAVVVLIVYILCSACINRISWRNHVADLDAITKARSDLERSERKKLLKSRRLTWVFWTNLACTGAAVLVTLILLYVLISSPSIEQYDPFKILGIEKSATTREIKKAYHKKSLLHHPDRHGGDDTMFKHITDAYNALTDEEAKENYRLYGNPNGRQKLEVSMGLPSFLLDKENNILVITGYVIAFGVLLPLFLWKMRRSPPQDVVSKEVKKETYLWLSVAMPSFSDDVRMVQAMSGCRELYTERQYGQHELDLEVGKVLAGGLKRGKVGARASLADALLEPAVFIPDHLYPKEFPVDLSKTNYPFPHPHTVARNAVVMWSHLARSPLRCAQVEVASTFMGLRKRIMLHSQKLMRAMLQRSCYSDPKFRAGSVMEGMRMLRDRLEKIKVEREEHGISTERGKGKKVESAEETMRKLADKVRRNESQEVDLVKQVKALERKKDRKSQDEKKLEKLQKKLEKVQEDIAEAKGTLDELYKKHGTPEERQRREEQRRVLRKQLQEQEDSINRDLELLGALWASHEARHALVAAESEGLSQAELMERHVAACKATVEVFQPWADVHLRQIQREAEKVQQEARNYMQQLVREQQIPREQLEHVRQQIEHQARMKLGQLKGAEMEYKSVLSTSRGVAKELGSKSRVPRATLTEMLGWDVEEEAGRGRGGVALRQKEEFEKALRRVLDSNRAIKMCYLEPALRAVKLQQSLVQALEPSDHPALQIPVIYERLLNGVGSDANDATAMLMDEEEEEEDGEVVEEVDGGVPLPDGSVLTRRDQPMKDKDEFRRMLALPDETWKTYFRDTLELSAEDAEMMFRLVRSFPQMEAWGSVDLCGEPEGTPIAADDNLLVRLHLRHANCIPEAELEHEIADFERSRAEAEAKELEESAKLLEKARKRRRGADGEEEGGVGGGGEEEAKEEEGEVGAAAAEEEAVKEEEGDDAIPKLGGAIAEKGMDGKVSGTGDLQDVHAPFWPGDREEQWLVLIEDDFGTVLNLPDSRPIPFFWEVPAHVRDEVMVRVQCPAALGKAVVDGGDEKEAGQGRFLRVHVLSTQYKGLDHTFLIPLRIHHKHDVRDIEEESRSAHKAKRRAELLAGGDTLGVQALLQSLGNAYDPDIDDDEREVYREETEELLDEAERAGFEGEGDGDGGVA